MKKTISLLPLLITATLFAQNGSGCVVETYGKEHKDSNRSKKHIENTCNVDMYVFWCTNKETGLSESATCGGDKYYKKFSVLKPGEKKFNQYSIPKAANVYIGACILTPQFSNEKSVSKFNPDGSYECVVDGVKNYKSSIAH